MSLRPPSSLAALLICLAIVGCSDDRRGSNAAPDEPVTATSAASAETQQSSTTSTVPSVAEGEPLPGRLAIVLRDGSLVVSRPDGEVTHRLHDGSNGVATQPTWSGDGRRLSWTIIRPGEALLRVHDFDTEAAVEVTTPTPAFYHSFNADGTHLATLRSQAPGIQLEFHDPQHGTTQPVAIGQPFFLDWAATGSLAVIAVNEANVAKVDADDGTAIDLPLPVPLAAFQAPAVLPDGSYLIAVQLPDGPTIVRVTADGTPTPIARFEGRISMTVAADGSRLAVLVSPDPNGPRLQQASFSVTAQATPLLASGRVTVIDLDSGAVRELPQREVITANWSPDGQRLAGLRFGAGGLQWVVDDGGTVIERPIFTPSRTLAGEYLPFADQYDESHTWWSPDGRALLMVGEIDGEAGVWVDLVDTPGPPRLVADGVIAFWSPT